MAFTSTASIIENGFMFSILSLFFNFGISLLVMAIFGLSPIILSKVAF
jgi:hypothetical protein